MSTNFAVAQANTAPDELDQILRAADAARLEYARSALEVRAELLDTVADAIDSESKRLVAVAMEESHLPEARLQGEVGRTTFQLRLFADTVRDGAYIDARLDSADPDWPSGPRADIRSMLFPAGPVLNFAASNFPFAFSVAGGDSAAALAAGCPVIVKVHPGHPELSQLVGTIVRDCVKQLDLPSGVFALVFGDEAARTALTDKRVRVGTFTGSPQGGRALLDIANSRSEPIPFFAEMGSVNPVFVTAEALSERLPQIAKGFAESFTLGVGQFCTKPGVLVLPADRREEFSTTVAEALADTVPGLMLTERIRSAFLRGLDQVRGQADIRAVLDSPEGGREVGPRLFATTAEALINGPDVLLEEHFGPFSIVVGCTDEQQYLDVARAFTGELTASIHYATSDPTEMLSELVSELEWTAGRLVFNQWPTGVAVTHAMVHGGPYPASSNYGATSVGTTSIGRFLRRTAFQNCPDDLLPEYLQDGNPRAIPRTVNGAL